MLKNYLLVSIRNMLKNKLFTTINIAGLAIGLSAVMLISLYIWDELTFDSYLDQQPGIYKLELETVFPGRGLSRNEVTGGAITVGLKSDYPELVKNYTRLRRSTSVVTHGDLTVNEEVFRVDGSFFEIFNLDYLAGSATSAQSNFSTVSISASAAMKYFGMTDVAGQVLTLDDGKNYQVGAVYQDFPSNTHIRPNLLFPLMPSERDDVSNQNGWWTLGYHSYIQLHEKADLEKLTSRIPTLIDKYNEENSSGEPMSKSYGLVAIPMADVHFETASAGAGDKLMLSGFGAVALVILSIATFNFMNMSVSRTVNRAREVAIRKVHGAQKGQIVQQFLSETMLLIVISLLLAFAITEFSLIWFNDFVSKLMNLGVFTDLRFVGGLAVLVLFMAFSSGMYPASLMASVRPVSALRGGKSKSKNVSKLNNLLVTMQFAVAIGLIIAATVIYQQVDYSKNMDAGYDKENLLLVKGISHPSVRSSAFSIQQSLEAIPDITSVSQVDQAPGGRYGWIETVDTVGGEQLARPITVRGMGIDTNFLDAFSIKLIAGRPLSNTRELDYGRKNGEEDYRETYNILVNEKALVSLGLGTPEEALGKTIGRSNSITIVGVINDYLLGSSKGTVPPMIFTMNEPDVRLLAVRFQTTSVSGLMNDIERVWTEFAGDRPLRVEFMDDRIAALYKTETQQGEVFALFAGLAIFVSGIGLYGLASYNVTQRTKEIGVRKVLGASTFGVARKIMWDYSKPILIANAIAWPVAGYLMHEWLQAFTYRIDLSSIHFLGATFATLAIASIAVGGHVLKVASAKPIHALRYE